MITGLLTPGVASPLHKPYLTWSNKDSIVFRLRLTKIKYCAAFAPANLLQKANSGSNWRLSSEQVGRTECSIVCHVPGPRGYSPGYFLPQHAIHSMFISGAGRQSTSASPVLIPAKEVRITWLKCCRLCEHE